MGIVNGKVIWVYDTRSLRNTYIDSFFQGTNKAYSEFQTTRSEIGLYPKLENLNYHVYKEYLFQNL